VFNDCGEVLDNRSLTGFCRAMNLPNVCMDTLFTPSDVVDEDMFSFVIPVFCLGQTMDCLASMSVQNGECPGRKYIWHAVHGGERGMLASISCRDLQIPFAT
jgi:hypothetical protein